MDELIPIASKLQDVLGALGQSTSLDLPQIVVVGGQSSGKSSVLEALVGRSFLPRGSGIVTRRPLILQLYNTNQMIMMRHNSNKEGEEEHYANANDDEEHPEEWGEFLHHPNQIFSDFNEIRREIVRETDRLTGSNKGIHPTPIHLKIYSPYVLNLTLVDLPGMTKVAVGDQPTDIEQQVRDMSLQYIRNPNAIILAVSAANADLANSDALQLSQSVDPYGNRTIGVLTKLDLMDPGTDALDILQNKVIPLRRGYIGVVNRGQRDIDNDMTIRDGLKKEEVFFRNHPVYGSSMRSGGTSQTPACRVGTKILSKTLNMILMHHIRDVLPELKNRISIMMAEVQAELDALGEPASATSRSELGGTLLNLLSKFATNFANMIDGRGGAGAGSIAANRASAANAAASAAATAGIRGNGRTARAGAELFGGARISYIFTSIFAHSLLRVGPYDGLTNDEIRTTISNANGTRPSALFVPEISFDILVRRQIARLEEPGIQCVDLVFEELQRIASQAEPSELERYPLLRDRIVQVVQALLKRCVSPTQMMVSNLVKIELAYINTSHPDFIGGSRAVAKLMEKMHTTQQVNNNGFGGGGGASLVGGAGGAAMDDGTLGDGSLVGASSLVGAPSVTQRRPHAIPEEQQNGGPVPPNHPPAGPGAASSLSNYYEVEQQLQQQDTSGGGLMNFIFRGGSVGGGASVTGGGSVVGGNNNYQRSISAPANMQGSHPPKIVHLPQVPNTMRQSHAPLSERERVEMEIIKNLLESYFNIVRKNFIDMVPKTIMYFLVNHVRDACQNELVSELYNTHSEELLSTLMQEAEDVAQRRQTCKEMKELLSKALEIVNEVRDYNSFQ